MSSKAYRRWISTRAAELDQMENAHSAVGGKVRGRRYTTDQINHAYAVLLASQFQGFCKDLHSESVEALTGVIEPLILRPVIRRELTRERKLDRGNANPGNLGEDFGRLGVAFWSEVEKLSPKNAARNKALETLNHWRNAIVHQDLASPRLGSSKLRLAQVRIWRVACGKLAWSFDRVMQERIIIVTGKSPW